MFNRKFSSNIRRRKRMIISSIILLVACLGLGYSAFSTNLGINGTLNVSKYDHTLYGVLEKAVSKGYAQEYTGSHQDSMAGVGSEKIYHWYAPSTTAGNRLANEILEKNNVVFADHCWQMIRTADTGGVKMIYNGEAENNQCLNTRGSHAGYEQRTTQSMSTTYYYGTSYTYDKTNNVFSLDGTVTTGTIQTGQYTCKQTTSTGTCATLYLVDTLSSGTTYYVLPLNGNSHYSQFGTLQFNQNSNSPSYVGYMYNTVYPAKTQMKTFYVTMSGAWGRNTNHYYSDTIDYNTITPNEYTLVNPIQISSSMDYSTLIGKYVLFYASTTHGARAGYVTGFGNDKVYCKELINGDLNTSLTIGDSYIKNGNTYTLVNPINVSYIDWYANTSDYSIYKGKYVCDGNNTSCSNLRRIYTFSNPLKYYFYYYDTTNTYSFSENVSYSSGVYTLTGDIKTFWDFEDATNKAYLATHHYTCLNTGTSCSTVDYITWLNSSLTYVELTGVQNLPTALNNILNANDVNQTNSTIKMGIDAWYKKYMTNYSSELEDIIFCNDRTINALGSWNPNGGIVGNSSNNYLNFKNYYLNTDLGCTNTTDKFSMVNANAQLTYPVGLLTYPEMKLLTNTSLLRTNASYWLLSPTSFIESHASGSYVNTSGTNGLYDLQSGHGVRPVISLKPGTEYVSGTGSTADPYIVQ